MLFHNLLGFQSSKLELAHRSTKPMRVSFFLGGHEVAAPAARLLRRRRKFYWSVPCVLLRLSCSAATCPAKIVVKWQIVCRARSTCSVSLVLWSLEGVLSPLSR